MVCGGVSLFASLTLEFAEYIGSRQSAEIQQEIRRQERELTAMRKRGAELDAIFKKLYEDRVLGQLSVEQFQTLSSGYTEERGKLAAEIPVKESAIQKIVVHEKSPRQEISA